ncbi:Inner membrane transport protein YnfM [compost metagenome]
MVFTFGFFAAHAVASGWVGQMARGYKALGASLYLLVYYVGSSVLGAWGGHFWAANQWPGVAAMAGGLLAIALAISAGLAWRTSGVRGSTNHVPSQT